MAALLERALESELAVCCHTLSSLSTALAQLATEIDAMPSGAASHHALQQLAAAAGELREAFAFIDSLELRVAEAELLVEATDRRLGVLERGECLPDAIAQLPPAQFSAHLFCRQLRRREVGSRLELPELSALPPAELARPPHAAPEPSRATELELAELERRARVAALEAREAALSAAATAAGQARTAAATAADGARTLFKRLQGEWRLP
ncbi:hypothetical protein AB1Y20_004118 [Prymnesium parvum]|uniref:Mediator of RNA polymerase II transcription subunit 4 n=1 Tax=Prymnesium parvum TaxID=97485 RepID=A0AB34J6P9_PRYPA